MFSHFVSTCPLPVLSSLLMGPEIQISGRVRNVLSPCFSDHPITESKMVNKRSRLSPSIPVLFVLFPKICSAGFHVCSLFYSFPPKQCVHNYCVLGGAQNNGTKLQNMFLQLMSMPMTISFGVAERGRVSVGCSQNCTPWGWWSTTRF